jgi:hypothetical protein
MRPVSRTGPYRQSNGIRRLGRAALALLERIARGTGGELGENLTDIGAGEIHLIESLNGAQARCGARHWRLAAGSRQDLRCLFLMDRAKRIMASAVSAAPPPLSISVTRARAQA